MNTSPDNSSPKKGDSLNRFHCEAATSSMENAGIAYQSPSLVAAGAGDRDMALMSFFTNLVLSALYIKAPRVAEKIGSPKRSVLFLSLFSAITWIPLILVFALRPQIDLFLVVGLWIFSLVPTTLLLPLRDGWLAGQLPAGSVGRYLGVRSLVSSAAYLLTFSLMGYLLNVYRGQIFHGYAAVLTIAFIASLGGLLLYRTIAAPAEVDKERVSFGIVDFFKGMKGGSLGVFILFVSLFNLSVFLCSPLFAIYILRDLNFSYLSYTLIISVEYIARIVSAAFWGKYADRAGSLKVMGIVSRLIPLVPVLWLFSSDLGYLIAIQLFSGTLWAGFDLCSQTFIYKSAPENRRLQYIGYHKSLVTMAMALGALSGAYLLTVVAPVLGSRILALFLVSGIARLLVVRAMFSRLVDLAWTARAPQARARTPVVTPAPGVTAKRGLFYRPQEWNQPPKAAPVSADRIQPIKRGLFYRPEAWTKQPEAAPASTEKIQPWKRGLFYRPQEWAQHLRAVPVSADRPQSSRRGLFRRPRLPAAVYQANAGG
ncbi:MAG: MFS transporter [Chloroflexota bacterium]